MAAANVARDKYIKSVEDAEGLVYGVMIKQADYKKDGTFRVIHVYRGPYMKGQRIRVTAGYPALASCPVNYFEIPKGDYGVLAIAEHYEGNPIPINNFVYDFVLDHLFEEGAIRRAIHINEDVKKTPG